jgi:hypothetical protein
MSQTASFDVASTVMSYMASYDVTRTMHQSLPRGDRRHDGGSSALHSREANLAAFGAQREDSCCRCRRGMCHCGDLILPWHCPGVPQVVDSLLKGR